MAMDNQAPQSLSHSLLSRLVVAGDLRRREYTPIGIVRLRQ